MSTTARRVPRLFRLTCSIGLAAGLLAAVPGCGIIGAAASKVTRTMVQPAYTGLANETVGVMVTADRGTQIEYPRVQLDVAQSVQAKLQGAQKNEAKELTGTQFPASANPSAIFAFQRNYPQYDVEPIASVAPRLGVSRVIYIEIETLALNPGDVMELFRGEAVGRVRVVEVSGNQGKIVFSDKVSAVFPEDAPPDGLPNLNRSLTYRGLIDSLGTAVVEKFIAHETY